MLMLTVTHPESHEQGQCCALLEPRIHALPSPPLTWKYGNTKDKVGTSSSNSSLNRW